MNPDASDLMDRAERHPSHVDPVAVTRSVNDGDLTPDEGAQVLVSLAENADENPLGDLEPLLTGRDHSVRTTVITALARVGDRDPELVEPLVPTMVSELGDDTFQTSTHLLRALRVVAPAYPTAFRSSVEELLSSLSSTGRDGREAVVSILYWVSEDDPELLIEHVDALQAQLDGLSRAEADARRTLKQSSPAEPVVREIKEDRLFNDRTRVLLLQTLTNVAGTCDEPASVIDIGATFRLAKPDQYPEVRRACLGFLGTVARSEPGSLRDRVTAVSEYAAAENERVAGTAAWTLAALADAYPADVSAAMESQVGSVLDLLWSDAAETRGHALGLLAYLAEEGLPENHVQRMEPRLVDLLSDDHDFVRVGAVLTLESLRAAGALDELERMSETDPDPEVRQAATEAVRAIDSKQ